jgi:hypothetical protein
MSVVSKDNVTASVADKRINEFLNENWKELAKEMSPIVNTVFGDIVFRFQTRLDSMVPFDVSFPEHLP